MFKRLLVGLALLISVPVFSQTVAVTSAVTDSQSTLWTSARWQVQFFPNPNQTNICSYQVSGVSICSNTYKQYLNQNGTSDANTGLFTVTLLDNTQINPSGSKWVFTIQSNTSAPAVQYAPVQVTSSTTSLTSFLSSNSTPPTFPALGLGYYGYSDSEVFPIPQPGGFYFNVVNAAQRFWNGSNFTQSPNTSSQNTWTNTQNFSPLNLPFTSGVANNIAANPTWNGRINSSMTINTTEYGYISNPYSSRPGINRGGYAITAPNWTVLDMFKVNGTKYGQGFLQGGLSAYHTGPGDTIPWYVVTASNGGAIIGDDEGTKGPSSHTGEGVYTASGYSTGTYSGTIQTGQGGTGATQIKTNIVSNNLTQGDGEYLLDLTPLSSGCSFTSDSTASGYETITTNASCTFPVSTAYGTLAANVLTPVGNPVGVGSTQETLTFSSVTGTFTVGGLGCFAGINSNKHEQALVTAVSGSGNSQTVTLNLREQHPSGTYFFEGGPCGHYAVADALLGDGNLKYPVDIVGATAANTVVVQAFGPGGNKYISSNSSMSQIAIISVASSGTTVTFNFNQGGFDSYYSLFNNTQVVTFSGLSDSALNTQCTNLTTVYSTKIGTCTIAGLSGTHSAASGFVAYGNTAFGNTTFTVYSGAEILDIQNPTNQSIDGSFTLEDNNTAWNNGDTVEAEHLPGAIWNISTNSLEVHNPAPFVTGGIGITLKGAGIIGGPNPGAGLPPQTGALNVVNQNAFSFYTYGGKIQNPAPNLNIKGPWGGNYFQYAPCWGCRSFWIGAPNSGASDVNYMYYSPLDAVCATGECGLQFWPGLNTWQSINTSEIYNFHNLKNWNATANAYQAVVTLNSAGTPGHISQWASDGGLQDGGILSPTTSTIAWTPTAASVSSCVEQAMPSIPNLVANRMVFVNPPAALGSHVWIGSVRSTGANNITVDFCADATGGTPPSGNWGWGAL